MPASGGTKGKGGGRSARSAETPPQRQLALFDFDGTLTRSDSLFGFVRSARGAARLALGTLWTSPALLAHGVGLLDGGLAKERFLAHFFRGWSREALQRAGREFASGALARDIRPRGLARLRWHLDQGHRVALVTASAQEWVQPWAAQHRGLEVIATELAYDSGGSFTGAFAGANCKGREKVRRIRAAYAAEDYDLLHCYGDSPSDRPMLGLAERRHRHYKPFRSADSKAARKSGRS